MFWLAICACVQCWVLDLWTIFVLALLPLIGNLIFSILLLYSLKTVSSKFISVCRMKEIQYQFNFKISTTITRFRIQSQNAFFCREKDNCSPTGMDGCVFHSFYSQLSLLSSLLIWWRVFMSLAVILLSFFRDFIWKSW